MSDASAPPLAALSILMVASEAQPYAKTGGLADVTGALPGALARLGHSVTLVMPRYREVGAVGRPGRRLTLAMGGRVFDVGLVEVTHGPREQVVFVECGELFDREGLYGSGVEDHPDNAVRFGILSRAALEYASGLDSPPSIVHAHDWQTGLVGSCSARATRRTRSGGKSHRSLPSTTSPTRGCSRPRRCWRSTSARSCSR